MNAVRAELEKLLTLPSLALTLGLTWAVTLLLDALDPPGGSVLPYGQVGFLILGVLATAHEYQGGGQIRTTLLAMPRRYRLVAAKAVALVVLAAPAALLVAGTAGEPDGTLPLVVDALVAAGVGMLVRHPVGAAGAVLIAYEIGLPLIRTRWGEVTGWLPPAGLLIFGVRPWCSRAATGQPDLDSRVFNTRSAGSHPRNTLALAPPRRDSDGTATLARGDP